MSYRERRAASIDAVRERAMPRLVRLRKKIGVNEFSYTLPNGQPDEDYMEPLRGLRGVKHTLAIYLMK